MAMKDEKGEVVGKCTACKGSVLVEKFPKTTYHCGSCGLMYHFPPPAETRKRRSRAKQGKSRKVHATATEEICRSCKKGTIKRGRFLGLWFPPRPDDMRELRPESILTNFCPRLHPDTREEVLAVSLAKAERILARLGFGVCKKCKQPYVPAAYALPPIPFEGCGGVLESALPSGYNTLRT